MPRDNLTDVNHSTHSASSPALVTQIVRCLDLWLEERDITLARADRDGATKLLCRYFENEEDLSDQLVLNFLSALSLPDHVGEFSRLAKIEEELRQLLY